MTRGELLQRLYAAIPDCLDVNVCLLADTLLLLAGLPMGIDEPVPPEPVAAPADESPVAVAVARHVRFDGVAVEVRHPTPGNAPLGLGGNAYTANVLRDYVAALAQSLVNDATRLAENAERLACIDVLNDAVRDRWDSAVMPPGDVRALCREVERRILVRGERTGPRPPFSPAPPPPRR